MAAAALPAAAVTGQAVAAEAAGVIKGIINALEKPIWSNQETTVVTHVAQNGDIITRTRTKGWTIPLGVPVLIVGGIVVWEVGSMIASAVGKVENAVFGWMDPNNWAQNIVNVVDTVTGQTKSVTISRPPTAMASISNLVQNMVDPIAATGGLLGTKFLAGLGQQK